MRGPFVQCTQPPSLWPVQGCPRAFSSGNWGMNTLPQRCYMPSSTPNTQRRPSTLSKWVSTSVSTAPGNTSGNTLYFPPGGTKCLLAGKHCITTTRRGWDSNPRVLSDAGFQDRCIEPLCHPSKRVTTRGQKDDSGPALLQPDGLVPEQPPAGEHHGDSVLVRGGDDFFVSLGAAGLDDGFDAGLSCRVYAVAEGEERV